MSVGFWRKKNSRKEKRYDFYARGNKWKQIIWLVLLLMLGSADSAFGCSHQRSFPFVLHVMPPGVMDTNFFHADAELSL